jgi:hypothetical protein
MSTSCAPADPTPLEQTLDFIHALRTSPKVSPSDAQKWAELEQEFTERVNAEKTTK